MAAHTASFAYGVRCPNCDSTITLLVGAGVDARQPLFFVCARCRAATRVTQILVRSTTPTAHLEYPGGEVGKPHDSPDQVIHIHPDLPGRVDASAVATEDATGEAPSREVRTVADGPLIALYRNVARFRERFSDKWESTRRLLNYYVEGDWAMFDKEGQRRVGTRWTSADREWKRHDRFQHAIEEMFHPVLTHDYAAEMHASMRRTIDHGNVYAVLDACQRSADRPDLLQTQARVLRCLESMFDHMGAYLPALAVESYPGGVDVALRELRLFRDDFDVLRDLYVRAYGACHDTLVYAVAITNAAERGDPHAFESGGPENLDHFATMPAKWRIKWLGPLEAWKRHFPRLLEPELQRVLRDGDCEHDLTTGIITLPDGPALSYFAFAYKVLNVLYPLLSAADALKYFRVYKTVGEGKWRALPSMRASRSDRCFRHR